MQVLWWLVPPLAATFVAMGWVAWVGRERAESSERDNRDAALRKMERAMSRPTPRSGTPVASTPLEPSHGVALRRAPSRPGTVTGVRR